MLELELEVAVELLSSSSLEDEVLVEEDEEEVPVAVELDETPLAPALPVGDRPVEAPGAPVATTVDWLKVEAWVTAPPVAETPLLTGP